MGILDDFIHPERPYEDADEQLRKYWEQAQGFQQPYTNAGKSQIGRLTGAEDSLMNPVALQNQWTSSYEMSPYAQQQLALNKSAGLDAASSMGLLGSNSAVRDIQSGAGDIVQKDRQQYLQDLMQKYMAGIGIGQNMFDTGASTASNLGRSALDIGNQFASSAFNQRQSRNNMLSNILSNTVGMGASYLTGGMGTGGFGQGVFKPTNIYSPNVGRWGA